MHHNIIYVQYTNPAAYPSLEHSSHILAQDGWEILFLGVEVAGAETLRFPSHPDVRVRLLASHRPGWRQKLHYVKFALWVLAWVLRKRPSWIYASDALSCPVAISLNYILGVRIVYHEHDSPNIVKRETIHDLPSNFMRFVFWTRKRLAQRAQLCVLPNVRRAERFAAETNCNQRVVCVWNCPRREEVVPPRGLKANSRLRIYYHGNISRQLVPASVLKAVALLDGQVELRIVGYETIEHQGYVKELEREAQDLGITDFIQFVPALPRHELWRLAGQGDVGLALMPLNNGNVNLRFLIGASNKPFDYLACGLALLVSDLRDWREMYVEPGYGLACNPDDAENIAAALHWFLEHPVEVRAMGERGRQRILEDWNYEKQFAPVVKHLGVPTRSHVLTDETKIEA